MTNYRPLFSRVILRILPPKQQSSLVLPDGTNHQTEIQHYEVVAVGDDVTKINAGQIVLAAFHPSNAIGLSKDDKTLIIDQQHIVCVVEEEKANN